MPRENWMRSYCSRTKTTSAFRFPCCESDLFYFHLLHPLRDLNVPSQLFCHSVAQLRRRIRLAMYEVSHIGFVAERVQPLQKLRRVRVITELLQGGNLCSNRHRRTEYLHLWSAALYRKASRPRRLKSNKQHGVLRIGQPLRQVMLNPSSGYHPA